MTKKEKSTQKNSKNLENSGYKCDHCDKVLKTESGFMKHSCKKKLRWIVRNENYSQRAFQIFIKFGRFISRRGKDKTFDDFINSSFYDYFVELANFTLNGFMAFPEKYTDYLFSKNIKMILWSRYETYEKFLLDYYKKEDPVNSIEKTLSFIGKWAEDREESWVDFFDKITPSLAITWIQYGKISPWILYCDKLYFGMKIFNRLSDEQLNMIAKIIDPLVWNKRISMGEIKIKDYANMLKEQGM